MATLPTPNEPNPNEPEPTDPDIFTWEENGDGTYTVTGLKSGVTVPETLVIPSTYNGGAVTAIGNDAFWSNSIFTSVTIPDSVITIGDSAFSYCSGLASVTIGDSVTTIGNSAFFWCNTLQKVTMGNGVTIIGSQAFEDCHSLKEVTFGNSLTTIGPAAFDRCYSLERINIPDSLTYIHPYGAFADCSNLQYNIFENAYYLGNDSNPYVVLMKATDSSNIHENTKVIDAEAFVDCYNLMSVSIPSNVVYISGNPFQQRTTLTSIVVDDDNSAYQSIDGNLYSKDGTLLIAYAIGKTDTSFTIPDSVTTIGDYAFYACTGLTSITIPDGVTTIGDYAFWYCTNLTSVTIGDSVTTIGGSAFEHCTNLTSVTIGDSVTTIGMWAFAYCSNLTSVTIGNSVTTIGNFAFYFCDNLTSITFDGTIEQWNAIELGYNWDDYTGEYTIYCTDGTIAKNGTVTHN